MSGIAGIVRLDGAPVLGVEINAMLATLCRRGPDRQAAWLGENAAFAQALLATTPEATAEAQPFVAADTGCVVVSDSRLDNRPQLLRDLGMLHAPPDAIGDGELLHAAWQRWGEPCVERLLGDFAFALWDPARCRLFLARDVFGVRPMYYHHVPGRLIVFASQTDSLLALSFVPAAIDPARLADAVVGELEGYDSVSSFFPAIKRLAPAHCMEATAQCMGARRYWTATPVQTSERFTPQSDWPDALRDALGQSVQRRLRANGRVGSMLSGGLDSASIVALARQQSHDPAFPVFSAIDSRGGCAETAGIRRMRAAFALQPHCADLADLSRLIPALRAELDCLAEPFDGAMPLVAAQYLMASAAGIRILLDGMPADLLYGIGDQAGESLRAGALATGYALFRDRFRADARAWPRAAALRSSLAAFLPERLRSARQGAIARAEFQRLLATSVLDGGLVAELGMARRYLHFHLAGIEFRSGRAGCVMDAPYVHAAVDRYGRVAARHGIEPRHPFLDRDLVLLHRQIPAELMFRDGWSKWPLRQALSGLLPIEIAWSRPRRHLGDDFNQALMEGLSAAGGIRLPNGRTLVSPERIAAVSAGALIASGNAFGTLQDAWLCRHWLEMRSGFRLDSMANRWD